MSSSEDKVEMISDSRVLNTGHQLVNGSFPLCALRQQVVSASNPTYGVNGSTEWRVMPPSNNLVSLYESYFDLELQIIDTNSTRGAGDKSADPLYTCINPNILSLWSNANLFISSTVLENVTNLNKIGQWKMAKMSKGSMDSNFSDVFNTPVDSMSIGCPAYWRNKEDRADSVVPNGVQTLTDIRGFESCGFDNWDSSTLKRNDGASGPTRSYNEICPAYLRALKYCKPTSGGVKIHGNTDTDEFYSDVNDKPKTVKKRVPLSLIFGACEKQEFYPSSLINIIMTRGKDEDFVLSGDKEAKLSVNIVKMDLILKHYECSQEALAVVDKPRVMLLPHYRHVENTLNNGVFSTSLQAFSGTKRITVFFETRGENGEEGGSGGERKSPWASWQSCPPGPTINASILYRGKQLPMLQSRLSVDAKKLTWGTGKVRVDAAVAPTPVRVRRFQLFNPEKLNADVMWDNYQACLLENEAIGAGSGPGMLYNINDFVTSQCYLTFKLTEDNSESIDTLAGPATINLSCEGVLDQNNYPADSVTNPPTAGTGGTINYIVHIVFERTNVVSWDASRNFTFLSGGSS